MTIDVNNPKHLIADEGKVLKQISSGIILGYEVFLGKVIINGELVDDFPENFEEIDDIKPEPDNNINIENE